MCLETKKSIIRYKGGNGCWAEEAFVCSHSQLFKSRLSDEQGRILLKTLDHYPSTEQQEQAHSSRIKKILQRNIFLHNQLEYRSEIFFEDVFLENLWKLLKIQN